MTLYDKCRKVPDVPRRDPTEDDYYNHIVAVLDYDGGEENPLIDHVAGHDEWAMCKRALLRWIAKQDAEYDEMARLEEHDG